MKTDQVYEQIFVKKLLFINHYNYYLEIKKDAKPLLKFSTQTVRNTDITTLAACLEPLVDVIVVYFKMRIFLNTIIRQKPDSIFDCTMKN